jgi:hypothetical protein
MCYSTTAYVERQRQFKVKRMKPKKRKKKGFGSENPKTLAASDPDKYLLEDSGY